MRKLTPKQERFIETYSSSLNASASARAAGYAARRSDVAGSRLLANPAIKRVLAARKAREVERADVSAERVLRELKNISFVSAADFFDERGNVLPPTAWTPAMAAAIAGFEVTKRHSEDGDGEVDVVLRVRLWDKCKSLEMLMRHFNLMVEKTEHRGTVTIQWLSPPAETSATVAAEAVTPVWDTQALPGAEDDNGNRS